MTELRTTVCNRDCPDTCRIVATVESTPEGERVVKLGGDPDHPVTRGFLCYRTNRFLETQYAPDRVTQPLRRRGDGFEPIDWDEALDWAAERLTAIRDESGPAAIFHYRSGGTLGLMPYVCEAFWEHFGPVTVKRGDICSGAGEAAQELDFGICESHDLFDLLESRNIVLWGKNVVVSSPHTVPVLRDAQKRGAQLVLIDPVHQASAKLCDRFVQPRPGGDFALAMAVALRLFERGDVDPKAATYCDHLDRFRALAESRSVGAWCADADVPVDVADDLAERLGPGKPTAILVGWGMGRRRQGGAIVRALDGLAAISGNLGISGGGVSFYFRRRESFDTSFTRGKAAAPRTIPEPLFGPAVLAADDPPIRAIWVTAGNPVAMLPDSVAVQTALRQTDVVVVVDSFLTDTAREADLVLPPTTLLEADDLLGAYGHHYLGASTPVVDPPDGVRSDLRIIQGLAERVGLSHVVAGDARSWKERMVAPKLGRHGVTVDDLEAGAVRQPGAAHVLFEDRRFPTPTGRVNLITEAPAAEDPRPGPDELVLMAISTRDAQSSQWAKPVDGPPLVTVHPDAAAHLDRGGHGETDDPLARLVSARGQLVVRLRLDPRQRRDVALAAKGGHMSKGQCMNALIDAHLTDLGGGGALYGQIVRLRPL